MVGWDRYWHRVLGIGRYHRYQFGIGIGNNSSIPAPIPHACYVCVTKTIVLCFDDAHQCAPSFVYKQAREEAGGVSPAVQSICVRVYLICVWNNDHCCVVRQRAITLSSLSSPSLSSRWPTAASFTLGVRLHTGPLSLRRPNFCESDHAVSNYWYRYRYSVSVSMQSKSIGIRNIGKLWYRSHPNI